MKLYVTFLCIVSLCLPAAEAQPAVLSHPFAANRWHTLACHRDRRWQCRWEMRRVGNDGIFHPVELGTKFVKAGPLPGDARLFLNEITKGTYRCACRMDSEQAEEYRKIVYFYSSAQRFRCFQKEVAVTKGEPLILSVCYLSFLPEASSLSTVTLVAEATGNNTIAFLRNYSAHYVVHDPKPGRYHFQVTTSEYGDIQSASFNVTIVDHKSTVPTHGPNHGPNHGPTDTLDEWKIAISIIIPLIVGALFLTLVMLCVWRWRKRNGAAIRHNDNHGGNLPPAIGIGNLQNEDVGAVNHEAAEAVREDIHGEGDDADDLPVANAAPDNQNRENNGADDLPLAMPMAIIDNGIRGDHGAEEIEVDDEEFRESPSHQSVEQCTDRNDRYYAASDIVRMASSKGLSVNHTERINRPWDQHLSSSPVRSQAYHSLVTNTFNVQSSIESHLNQPKPFN